MPEEDENRYQELEAKRSEALAKGQKLPPQEEAEWQALEEKTASFLLDEAEVDRVNVVVAFNVTSLIRMNMNKLIT